MSNENSVYKPDGDLYKYTAEMKFVVDSDDITDIDSINIKYIMADYNYKENNMPMFFVTASLDKKLVDKIVKNQNSAYFILNIKRCISNSDMPDFYVDYINAQFIYFITDDINKTDEQFDNYEKAVIKKYRTLDNYGKKAIDALLEIEFTRCLEAEKPATAPTITVRSAARSNDGSVAAGTTTITEEQLKKLQSAPTIKDL